MPRSGDMLRTVLTIQAHGTGTDAVIEGDDDRGDLPEVCWVRERLRRGGRPLTQPEHMISFLAVFDVASRTLRMAAFGGRSAIGFHQHLTDMTPLWPHLLPGRPTQGGAAFRPR